MLRQRKNSGLEFIDISCFSNLIFLHLFALFAEKPVTEACTYNYECADPQSHCDKSQICSCKLRYYLADNVCKPRKLCVTRNSVWDNDRGTRHS